MKYFIGIDGGGTKTAFCLFDENGQLLRQYESGGTSYKHAGWETMVCRVREGVCQLLSPMHKDAEVYICMGAPNYGESKVNDARMKKELTEALYPYKFHLVNDSKVGWAGSLALQPGINIVAGTGTIAFGRDASGRSGVTGGWSDFFGDEGSCRWIGVKTMEYFSKEADGRLPKGLLYDVVMKHFGVSNPIDVIDVFESDYQPYRDKLASLQLLALQAAKEDSVAESLYLQSASELAALVIALYQKLEFRDGCKVSYSGGLFKSGEMILTPLKEKLKGLPIELAVPEYEPVIGAALLAAEHSGYELKLCGGAICI